MSRSKLSLLTQNNMKTYQILNENDILQEGDEYSCPTPGPTWAVTTRVGEKAFGLVLYRRLARDEVPSEKDKLLALIHDNIVAAATWGEKLEAVDSPTVEDFKNLEATVERLEQSLSTSQSANIGYAKVVADRHDYIQKLEEELSFLQRESADVPTVEHVKQLTDQLTEFEEVVKALLADNELYRRVIDKLTT